MIFITRKGRVKIIASITLIFLFGFFWIFDLAAIPLDEKIFLAHQVVKIKEGANLSEIAGIFKEKNLVKSSLIFNLIVRILGGEKKIKAGSYLFEEPFSAFEIAEKIISGDYGIEYRKILIKEGATVEEIGKIFEEEEYLHRLHSGRRVFNPWMLYFSGCSRCIRRVGRWTFDGGGRQYAA